ncbi:MAG: glycosyltransferase [Lachnospiraceae bacterium]|nr:glycosyltransferase [Lachnospiraceae bacterium]
MKILVLDIAASKTGAKSILQDFAEYVRNNAKEHEWIFVTGVRDMVKEAGNIRVILREDIKGSRLKRLMFELFNGCGFIKETGPDVVFSLENTLPKGKTKIKGKRIPEVLYVHQPLGFQKEKDFSLFKPEERHLAVYQHIIAKLIDSSVKRADKVIVQTEWMKKAVSEKCSVDPGKVYAVLPPLAPVPEGMEKKKFDCTGFIFPAGPILYKNHSLIIEAARLLNKKGIDNFRISFTLTEEEAGEKLVSMAKLTKENIEFKGQVERKRLFEAYASNTLIFPSYIETYGYPPAEARSVGGLVLASDTEFCREVLAGYENVRFFSPFDAEGLASLMEEVITGKLAPRNIEGTKNDSSRSRSSWGEVTDIIEKA